MPNPSRDIQLTGIVWGGLRNTGSCDPLSLLETQRSYLALRILDIACTGIYCPIKKKLILIFAKYL